MSDFIETRFPRPPALGYTSNAPYRVDIVETAGAWERRNLSWAQARHTYTFAAEMLESEASPLIAFWHAVGGQALGFRFKDWNDFQSCALGSTPTYTDQPLVALTTTTFQLTKRYTVGSQSRDRSIRKPVAATIKIAKNGSELTSGWSLEATTGIVTFAEAPGAGTYTWGGEFDVPVRFDTDLEVGLTFDTVRSVRFTLREVRT